MPAAAKFDYDPINRTLVPFTQEDAGLYNNLPLVNTLREPQRYREGPLPGTVTQPPRFYDEDQNKWQAKFAKSIQDRKAFKRLNHQ